MWSKGSIIIAQFSKYKITISQNRRSFLCSAHQNVKFLSGSRGPHGPDLSSPFGRKFHFALSDLFAAILPDNAGKFLPRTLQIPVGYLCDRCIGPVFHTCQSLTLLSCFGQVMHILGNKIAHIFPLWTSVFPIPLFRPWSLA